MTADSTAFLLQVSGVDHEALRGQTIFNLWDPATDPPERRLARVEFGVGDLRVDVLERLTWALLCWPVTAEIELYDEAVDKPVAAVRCLAETSTSGIEDQEPYRWRDRWLLGRSSAGQVRPDFPDSIAHRPFPPTDGLQQGWYRALPRSLTALDEESLADRERFKRRIQRILGRQNTAYLIGGWKRLRSAMVGRRKPGCRLSAAVARGLSAAYAVPASGSSKLPGVLMMLPRLSPGGAEKNAIDLAAALSRNGMRVHMVTTFGSTNTWSERARSTGALVWHLPDFLPSECWLRFLDAYVSRYAVDVIHISNSHWMYDELVAIKALHPELHVVTQIHAEGEKGDLDYPTLAAREDRHVDCHTVISHHLSSHLVSVHGVDEQKIKIVNTGIDIEREFSPTMLDPGEWRHAQGISANTQIVAFVGRFSDLKRPLVFLAMAELVLERRPDTRFVMKGEGPLLADIQRRLACNRFLRRAVTIEDARSAVAPLMLDADLLVLTSAMEGVAYVSFEAMALGLVQVSADVGAQSELITPDTGVLVPVGQGETGRFAEAVCSLLADEEKRARMSSHAMERVRQWSTVEDMGVAYMNVYKDLIGSGEASSERLK
jgi:glycosyltransferase involved in cell wall biosynthesis